MIKKIVVLAFSLAVSQMQGSWLCTLSRPVGCSVQLPTLPSPAFHFSSQASSSSWRESLPPFLVGMAITGIPLAYSLWNKRAELQHANAAHEKLITINEENVQFLGQRDNHIKALQVRIHEADRVMNEADAEINRLAKCNLELHQSKLDLEEAQARFVSDMYGRIEHVKKELSELDKRFFLTQQERDILARQLYDLQEKQKEHLAQYEIQRDCWKRQLRACGRENKDLAADNHRLALENLRHQANEHDWMKFMSTMRPHVPNQLDTVKGAAGQGVLRGLALCIPANMQKIIMHASQNPLIVFPSRPLSEGLMLEDASSRAVVPMSRRRNESSGEVAPRVPFNQDKYMENLYKIVSVVPR